MFHAKAALKIETRVLCAIHLFSENRAVYKVMW